MVAVNWLRSRQEENELSFWFSLASYDKRDRSWLNRAYLVYLFIFLSAWVFAVLTLFAGGGASLLRLLDPAAPAQAALLIEVLVLGIWTILMLWQACRRSPVVFSEQDAALLCQTPLKRNQVVLRWFFMPWLKSAVPFWLVAVTLGFSLAEISMPGVIGISRIGEYAAYGLRAWVVLLPVQLAFFALHWIIGVLRLHKDLNRDWLLWPVLCAAVLFFVLLLTAFYRSSVPQIQAVRSFASVLLYPLRQGFTGNALLPAVAVGVGAALCGLGLLSLVSRSFSLSRAAQETNESFKLQSAMRYGMVDYVTEAQTKKRLGVMHAPAQIQAFWENKILIWKDLEQTKRTFRFADVFNWISIFSLMLGVALLPDFGSRMIALVIWVIWIGRVSVQRIRTDLACWSLVRQLPISPRRFILSEMVFSWALAAFLSILGFLIGTLIARSAIIWFIFSLPVLTAAVALISAFDVIRRSKGVLLLNGTVASVGAIGIFLGILLAMLPFLIFSFTAVGFGAFLAFAASLVLALLAFTVSANACRNIDVI